MTWKLRILGYTVAELGEEVPPPAPKPKPGPLSDSQVNEKFDDVSEQLGEAIVVAFTQRPEDGAPTFDLTGLASSEDAIAIAFKGLVHLVLKEIGWEADDEEVEEDEDED